MTQFTDLERVGLSTALVEAPIGLLSAVRERDVVLRHHGTARPSRGRAIILRGQKLKRLRNRNVRKPTALGAPLVGAGLKRFIH